MLPSAWGLLGAARNTVLPPSYHFKLDYAASHAGTQAFVDMLLEKCPSLASSNARPSRLLPSGMLQTVYAGMADFSDVDQVEYVRKVFLTPDGGTVALDITPPSLAEPSEEPVPTVLCLHGLTGGSTESYVRNVAAHITKPKDQGGAGMRFVVLNSRGCAGTPVSSPSLYSGAETSDVYSTNLLLSRMFPTSPVLGLGFSLGGNVMAKYISESGKNNPLIGAIVVCAPFDFNRTADVLDSTFVSSIFSSVMGSNVRRLGMRHIDTLALDPRLHENIEQLTGRPIKEGNTITMPKGRRGTLRYADEILTRAVGGRQTPYGLFPLPSSKEYYDAASSLQYMSNLQRPLVVLAAYDDPIVPGSVIDSLRELVHTYPHAVLAETPCGGHLGFFTGATPRRWIHNPIVEIAKAIQDGFAAANASEGGATRARQGLGSGGPQNSPWKTGSVDSRNVQVEILPVDALRPVYPDIIRDSYRGKVMAWLRTQVLPHAPLVHPRDSPAGFDESTESVTLKLKLFSDSLRPEVGYIELPSDVDVGNNGFIIQGHNPNAPVRPA
ncbi:hypothetical protein MCUN1_002557 [Malassezia cuniculi]|uniref:AB hydrolase-1 domain-containing protein n=1 Tax=Malassezia cuniculi TaxID=948313 RepID=A0AAF0EWN7_9BASI|nr:hypothetical protein MCUN1_002557 [Malassezia cuniculi]